MKKFSEFIKEGSKPEEEMKDIMESKKIIAQEVEDYIRKELGYATDVKVIDNYLVFEVLIGKTGSAFDNFLEALQEKFGSKKAKFYEWVKPSYKRALFKIKI